MGHRRIGFVANAYPDSDVDQKRLKGLRESLAARGIICELPPIDSGYRGEIHAIVTNTTKFAYGQGSFGKFFVL